MENLRFNLYGMIFIAFIGIIFLSDLTVFHKNMNGEKVISTRRANFTKTLNSDEIIN